MDAFIKLTPENRRAACLQAEDKLGLRAASIEKDFWVCWTLQELFNLPVFGEHLTFKGGTSLAKAWKLIERFSEDIDVVVDRTFLGFGGESLSGKQRKKLIQKCSECIRKEMLPELGNRFQKTLPSGAQWSLEPASVEEDADQQTLLFLYPSALASNADYVLPAVRIEMGARSDAEPSESPAIQPYLADAFPDLLGPSSISVRTVVARRTFWDKVMLLHEETYRPPDKKRKARLARHYYDLWCLINKGVAEQALADHELFYRAARHREIFFGYAWMDYSTLRPGRLRLMPPDDQLTSWAQDFKAMRQEMFFGPVPDFDELMRVVSGFEKKFNHAGH